MSLPENMPSPGMDSPYILRLLFPDRNADRNARAFPGPGVFRSTTSAVNYLWSQPPLGSLAPGGRCGQPPLRSLCHGVAVSPGVNHLWGHCTPAPVNYL